MLDLRRILGLPQTQACEALTLAAALSDEAVFLLMSLVSITKSDDLRVLSIRQLEKKPSIFQSLRARGTTALEVLREIEKYRTPRLVLAARGFVKFRTTKDGADIKHRFSTMRAYLRAHGQLDPLSGDRVEDVAQVRLFMKWACEGRVVDPRELPSS